MRPKTLWIKHVYAQRASNQITMCTYTYIVWSIQSYSEQQKQCGCLCMDVCVFTKYSAVYIISISSHLSGLYVFDLGRQSRSRRLLRATVLPFLAVALPQRSKVDAVNRIWWHIRRAPNQPDIHIYIYKRIFYWWHCKSQCRVVILVECIWISKRIYIYLYVWFSRIVLVSIISNHSACAAFHIPGWYYYYYYYYFMYIMGVVWDTSYVKRVRLLCAMPYRAKSSIKENAGSDMSCMSFERITFTASVQLQCNIEISESIYDGTFFWIKTSSLPW